MLGRGLIVHHAYSPKVYIDTLWERGEYCSREANNAYVCEIHYVGVEACSPKSKRFRELFGW